eukprot:TRINITY_DN22956_c0_g1_i1.p2 TRINITY_DN22956_c0_g1~~TRINITY_DN22956_c0_g1_i1.p2  ORF type:complete len:129 (-),score=2.96 TRINITY_DN22956_c0_g1_i1:339-725(-)
MGCFIRYFVTLLENTNIFWRTCSVSCGTLHANLRAVIAAVWAMCTQIQMHDLCVTGTQLHCVSTVGSATQGLSTRSCKKVCLPSLSEEKAEQVYLSGCHSWGLCLSFGIVREWLLSSSSSSSRGIWRY